MSYEYLSLRMESFRTGNQATAGEDLSVNSIILGQISGVSMFEFRNLTIQLQIWDLKTNGKLLTLEARPGWKYYQ